ncbi:unnamed protein product [Clonostachys rosea]|uniref:SMP domain-containing protein n=1 Tax=Bionectria ochroleuca TaxID=29856 RepID=A0ABY6TVZ5_BIOOC|nr:unnamed protein product [Clonostachys rosea]
MLFSAFLAASAATLVVASYEESDDIALRSLTDIEERDEPLGGPESPSSRSLSGARSAIAREAFRASVDTKVPTPGIHQEEEKAREAFLASVDTKVPTLGIRQEEEKAREAFLASVDIKVPTPGIHQEEEKAREAFLASVDTKVPTPGIHQEEAKGIVAREVMSFRDRKA